MSAFPRPVSTGHRPGDPCRCVVRSNTLNDRPEFLCVEDVIVIECPCVGRLVGGYVAELVCGHRTALLVGCIADYSSRISVRVSNSFVCPPHCVAMERRASFPMYDFPWLEAAHDMLWSGIAEGLVRRGWTGVPSSLTHRDDAHPLWHEQELLLSQSCGWPLVDELEGKVATIGAFEYHIASADGPTSRSQIMMRCGSSLPTSESLSSMTAAVNSSVSLSGWISLVRAFPVLDGVWPGQVIVTGAHDNSLALLQAGDADLAAVDAVSIAQFSVGRPELLAGLVVVGQGPRIPCLPIIGPLSFGAEQLADVRSAIDEALSSRAGIEAAKPLLIKRFHARDYRDYERVQAMSIRSAEGNSRSTA